MTPKMSLRRNNIMKVYGEQVLAMYGGGVGVPLPRPSANVDEQDE